MDLKIKLKKLNTKAVVPSYAHDGDAGMDLVATSKWFEGNKVCYGTGIAMEIPYGYVGLVFPRSSISKKDLLLSNAVGVIDSIYRGEIMVKFEMTDTHESIYEVGERVAQIIIVPYPQVNFEEVDELSDSVRKEGGFGSTGK
jgi:dUTP pyrophosphatase